MDEREQDLSELRDYGHKLLDELRYPNIISMLRDTITHMADIAEEYSKEADKWHSKYDECTSQNEKLLKQIEDLTEAGERQSESLRKVIEVQADKIKNLEEDFGKQIADLRSHRDKEIDDYGNKVQALAAVQTALDKKKYEVEAEKGRLAENNRLCEEEKSRYEEKRCELEKQIELNQAKLDGYQELFDFKQGAQNKIDAVQKEADDKANAANKEIAEWNRRYDEEHNLRLKIEDENDRLKKQLQGDDYVMDNGSDAPQAGGYEGQDNNTSPSDDDEDGTK